MILVHRAQRNQSGDNTTRTLWPRTAWTASQRQRRDSSKSFVRSRHAPTEASRSSPPRLPLASLLGVPYRPSPGPQIRLSPRKPRAPVPHASPIPPHTPALPLQAPGPSPATPAPPLAAVLHRRRQRGPNLGFPSPAAAAAGRIAPRGASAMLPCARSVLRRRGLASSVLRRCGGEGECSTGAGELVANARCSSTLAAIVGGGGRVLERGGRWAYPQTGVIGAGRMARTQTRCFLGCGDGEEGGVLSKVYEERRVMGYSPEQMFAVVAAVDLYEDFVPWCQRSRIIRRHGDGSFDAELEIGFKFLVESYVSHVEMEKPRYIKTTASESGLFDHLINVWEFKPGPVPGTCDLYFLVDFKFQSPLYRQVASMFFKEVVSRLVSSLNDRCFRIYGPAVPVLENTYGQGR